LVRRKQRKNKKGEGRTKKRRRKGKKKKKLGEIRIKFHILSHPLSITPSGLRQKEEEKEIKQEGRIR
jgi:hypothetical protein